jgi:hypothetical protein
MSLAKAILAGKEKRQLYYGCQAFDRSCRSHGSCQFCQENRKHNVKRRIANANEQLTTFLKGQKDDSES